MTNRHQRRLIDFYCRLRLDYCVHKDHEETAQDLVVLEQFRWLSGHHSVAIL